MTGDPRSGGRARPNFYLRAFDADEQEALWEAERVDGIDDEIALLRKMLRKQVEDHPEMYDRMLKSIELLVRAVATKYRLSPKNAQDFAERLTQTLHDLGEQLAPGLIVRGGDV